MNGTVVEFHALTYSYRTASEYDDGLIARFHRIIALALVSRIIIRRSVSLVLSAYVDYSVLWSDTEGLTKFSYFAFRRSNESRDIFIAHSVYLCVFERLFVESFLSALRYSLLYIHDVLELFDKVNGYHRDIVYLVDAYSSYERFEYNEYSLVVLYADHIEYLFVAKLLVLLLRSSEYAEFERTDSLEERFFEIRTYAHDLARSLHLGAEQFVSLRELIERPSREFAYDVIDARLSVRKVFARLSVPYLVEMITDSDERRYSRYRITRRLGRKSRTSRNSRVDLDKVVFIAIGVERELYVASALYFESVDYLERSSL